METVTDSSKTLIDSSLKYFTLSFYMLYMLLIYGWLFYLLLIFGIFISSKLCYLGVGFESSDILGMGCFYRFSWELSVRIFNLGTSYY